MNGLSRVFGIIHSYIVVVMKVKSDLHTVFKLYTSLQWNQNRHTHSLSTDQAMSMN